jgi:hypothetical protein
MVYGPIVFLHGGHDVCYRMLRRGSVLVAFILLVVSCVFFWLIRYTCSYVGNFNRLSVHLESLYVARCWCYVRTYVFSHACLGILPAAGLSFSNRYVCAHACIDMRSILRTEQ